MAELLAALARGLRVATRGLKMLVRINSKLQLSRIMRFWTRISRLGYQKLLKKFAPAKKIFPLFFWTSVTGLTTIIGRLKIPNFCSASGASCFKYEEIFLAKSSDVVIEKLCA